MSKKNRLKNKEAAVAAGLRLDSSPAGVFRFPPWLFFAALLAWFFIVYRNYLPSHPLAALTAGISSVNLPAALYGFLGVLPSNALNLLFFALLVVLSYGIGSGLLSVLGLAIPAGERFIFSLGLGFGTIAYSMLLLGGLGMMDKAVILPVFILGSAVSAYRIRIWNFRAGGLRRELAELWQLGLAWKAMALLCAMFLSLNIIMAFVPEIFYDAHVYHLATPGYYLLKHQILPMRFLSHSNFPLNLSMIYALALALGNETLAKMIHGSMGLLTVLLLYLSAKRFYNAKTALFAALIFCSIPIFATNSWTCGNDVGVAFFFALAYVVYLDWLKAGEDRRLVLLSVFAGIAIGAKYTAAFCVTGLGAALAVHSLRSYGPARAAKKLFLYFGIVFLLLSPWLIKNHVFTGNPVQPFLNTVLGGENLKISGQGVVGLPTPVGSAGFKIVDGLLSPWTLTLAGRHGDSMGYVGPVLLLLLPCLLFIRKTDRLIKHSLALFCAGYLVWYMGASGYRYMLPLFVVLALCLGWAAYFISERFKVFKLLCTAILAVNFVAVFSMALTLGFDVYFAQGVSRDDFLSVSRPSYPNPPYAAIEWINKNLPQDSKVFFIGESRPFRMKRDFLSYSIELNVQPLMAYLKKAKDPDDFYALLRGENFTHLLINYREAIRNLTYKEFDWTKKEREIFDGFWKKHVALEYFREGVYVYSVLPDKVTRDTPNILEGLETDGWTYAGLLKLFTENRMWASCLGEYESYAQYGYDVRKPIEYFKALLAKEQ